MLATHRKYIGLIEVMGLAVLPARLKNELALLGDAIVAGKDYKDDEVLGKHYDWVQSFKGKYSDINADNVTKILQDEVGIVFAKVLEHAGVYKRDDAGKAAFLRFVEAVNG